MCRVFHGEILVSAYVLRFGRRRHPPKGSASVHVLLSRALYPISNLQSLFSILPIPPLHQLFNGVHVPRLT